MMNRMLVFLCLGGICLTSHMQPCSLAGTYLEPHLEIMLFHPVAIGISEDSKDRMATALAQAVSAGSFDEAHLAWSTRALGIALRLSPENRDAVVANGLLKRDGRMPKMAGEFDAVQFVDKLLKAADHLKANGGPDRLLLAGYLYSLAAEANSGHPDALFKLEIFSRDHPIDWSPIEEGRRPGSNDSADTAGVISGTEGVVHFQRQQSKVNGLFVLTSPTGMMIGSVIEIISTVTGHHVPNQNVFGFARPVGQEMFTSFEEAQRLMEVRYPLRTGGNDLRMSFSDKYSAKDGGSAGLAFSLLFVSMYENIPLDPNVAVTGDITVDGQIREVGGIAAKIRGARDHGCKIVIMPARDETELLESVLLNGPAFLVQIQIFGVADLDEALAIARCDRQRKLDASIKGFARIAEQINQNPRVLGNDPQIAATLRDMAAQTPNNLSVRTLLRVQSGNLPRKLTTATSLEETLMAAQPYFNALRAGYQPGRGGIAVAGNTREEVGRKLAKIQALASPDIAPLVGDFVQYAQLTGEMENLHAGGKLSTAASRDRRLAELASRETSVRKQIEDRLEVLFRDHEFLQRLLK